MCLGDRIEGSQPQRLSVSAAFTFRMIFPRQTLEKLRLRKTSFCPLLLFILGMMVTSPLLCAAGEKHRAAESAGRHIASYDLPQPENETIDYNAYQRIRKEGTTYSHVMEYASALMDAIGSRLTGSPSAKRANECPSGGRNSRSPPQDASQKHLRCSNHLHRLYSRRRLQH